MRVRCARLCSEEALAPSPPRAPPPRAESLLLALADSECLAHAGPLGTLAGLTGTDQSKSYGLVETQRRRCCSGRCGQLPPRTPPQGPSQGARDSGAHRRAGRAVEGRALEAGGGLEGGTRQIGARRPRAPRSSWPPGTPPGLRADLPLASNRQNRRRGREARDCAYVAKSGSWLASPSPAGRSHLVGRPPWRELGELTAGRRLSPQVHPPWSLG